MVKAAFSSLNSNPTNADPAVQLKVATIQDKYAVTFDAPSETLRIFDSASSRGLIYEAARGQPATVNHLVEADLSPSTPLRDPLEQRLISAAMSALPESGNSNPDLSFQVGTLADRYLVSFDKETKTLQIVDPSGERGVLYMSQIDQQAKVNKFEPSEIEALPRVERAPWEDAMLKQAISALNANPVNTDKDIKVASLSTPGGAYAVSHHVATDTIQLVDAKNGERGIVYQATRGASPTVSNFDDKEKQSFLTQQQVKAASFAQEKSKPSLSLD
jgi:hypothetical protein